MRKTYYRILMTIPAKPNVINEVKGKCKRIGARGRGIPRRGQGIKKKKIIKLIHSINSPGMVIGRA